jgi:hypothetical protein
MMLLPFIAFDRCDLALANKSLVAWGHKMGPIERPFPSSAYALFHEGEPVCVVVHGCLIAQTVGGGNEDLNRENTVELARLCAVRSGLCRVGLRLWREFVFPGLGRDFAISYQDADLHNGNTYRFDGWTRTGLSRSGTDRRTQRPGRTKYIWRWPK